MRTCLCHTCVSDDMLSTAMLSPLASEIIRPIANHLGLRIFSHFCQQDARAAVTTNMLAADSADCSSAAVLQPSTSTDTTSDDTTTDRRAAATTLLPPKAFALLQQLTCHPVTYVITHDALKAMRAAAAGNAAADAAAACDCGGDGKEVEGTDDVVVGDRGARPGERAKEATSPDEEMPATRFRSSIVQLLRTKRKAVDSVNMCSDTTTPEQQQQEEEEQQHKRESKAPRRGYYMDEPMFQFMATEGYDATPRFCAERVLKYAHEHQLIEKKGKFRGIRLDETLQNVFGHHIKVLPASVVGLITHKAMRKQVKYYIYVRE
eukprot:GHVS01004913.1.p1 GENE.GHVS01004913.1~~GHVS01004913.1.p1  ORF type:complete len:331 (+),score=69.64 GHVS01004913.1:36-995(+)